MPSVHFKLFTILKPYTIRGNDTFPNENSTYKTSISPNSTTEPIVVAGGGGDGTVMAYFNGNTVNINGKHRLIYNLYDVHGKLLTNGKLRLSENSNKGSVKVGSIIPGVYILKVQDEKGNTESIKLIKN